MTVMQIDRAVVEQVLEALEEIADEVFSPYDNKLGDAILALRAALAQQDEPLNLRDPAVQKRLATQWGYVPAAQAEPVEQLAELQAMLRAEVDRLIAAGIQPQRKPLTEEEIVDAVREAEMESRKLERFAALVAAAEREACAALLEANGMQCGEESLSRLILETNASAIRARSNT